MKAMVLNSVCDLSSTQTPLEFVDMRPPEPAAGQVLIRVSTCGVCHTELDEIEGRTPPPVFPVIPGHEVVGRVTQTGTNTKELNVGDRVGVAWIFWTCGRCKHCRSGDDNLCPEFMATGRDANGGYAEYMVVPEKFAFRIPDTHSDAQAAPLLCAGAIGYRSLRLTRLSNGAALGLTGFGASAHLVLQMARHQYPDSKVYVFARNPREREFAAELGAAWAGDTTDSPPEPMAAVIDTTPAWKPVVEALKHLESGGRLVINAIRKEAGDRDYLLKLDYPAHLWMEKEIKSVANVAGRDVRECLDLAAAIGLCPSVAEFALRDANQALMELKTGKIRGAKVLRI